MVGGRVVHEGRRRYASRACRPATDHPTRRARPATPGCARSPAARTATTGRTPTSPCVGVPFDTATSYRTARASARRRSATRACCCGRGTRSTRSTCSPACRCSTAATSRSRRATRSARRGRSPTGSRPVLAAGAVPLVLGGDHSIVLGELRAQAAAHGPVGVVLLDAHADTWDQYYGERYFHGTPFRRALEEGLIDPQRSLLAGHARPALRGRGPRRAAPLGLRDRAVRRAAHVDARASTASGCARASARGRCSSRSTSTCSTRRSRPATGTPEVAGLLPHEALAFLRALARAARSAASTSSRSRRSSTARGRSRRCTRPRSPTSCSRSRRSRGGVGDLADPRRNG